MKVLVVGAGIGGDALAVLLGQAACQVVVVELASGMRSEGQTVDLRGPSAAVLQRMELLERARGQLLQQRGIAWVDRRGRMLGRMPVAAFRGAGFVSYSELLRTDLSRLLHDACGDDVEHRFGDTVEELREQTDRVLVTFRSGTTESFDLVVGADGAHSRVRSLLLGPEERFRKALGLAHAWYTLKEDDRTPHLHDWWLSHNAPGRRVVEARPGHPGQQEIGFTFPAAGLPDRRDRAKQVQLLRQVFAGVGWRSAELVSAADTDDFALDTFDQIITPSWHTGRVALLGDAAWCASPLSGLGTALALVGAWTLAEELAGDSRSSGGPRAALERYETRMRPRAAAAQKLLPGRVRMYAPNTEAGIRATVALYTLAQTRPAAALLERLAGRVGHGADLPAAA